MMSKGKEIQIIYANVIEGFEPQKIVTKKSIEEDHEWRKSPTIMKFQYHDFKMSTPTKRPPTPSTKSFSLACVILAIILAIRQ